MPPRSPGDMHVLNYYTTKIYSSMSARARDEMLLQVFSCYRLEACAYDRISTRAAICCKYARLGDTCRFPCPLPPSSPGDMHLLNYCTMKICSNIARASARTGYMRHLLAQARWGLQRVRAPGVLLHGKHMRMHTHTACVAEQYWEVIDMWIWTPEEDNLEPKAHKIDIQMPLGYEIVWAEVCKNL